MSTLKETTIPRRDRKLCPVINTGEGLTEQAHKDMCDINIILEDYARTGFMRHAKQHAGTYDDVSDVDFQDAMIKVANVKSMFEGLPSEVRKEFGHDPAYFLKYVQDPANSKALAERGILVGNDGVDISGAYTRAPTQASVKAAESTASVGTTETAEPQTSESASGGTE